ncbi:MFS transporter [Actinoallomurus sp. CA-150999]|uniref:MFS transporter n=1 Tax=Actinoallomurus sp. CA-150999 TaxID=3239887 RepID=UPI003D8A1EF2
MGNAIEWFDYGIYGYLASYVGKAFFPAHDSTTRLLSTFGVLAISFAIRPFGGMFFGPLGDRLGRQRVLVLTLTLMSLSTFAIGVLPTYAVIGVWSPILLILARLLQGFSTGGEYGGAATFMAEYAPDDRRGFYGSFLEFGTLIGLSVGASMATLMSTLFSDATVSSWAWRVPFLIALPLGGIGLYLRTRLEDTPIFEELAARGETARAPFRETLRYWRPILILMGFVLLLNVTDYGILTYMPTYLKDVLGLSEVAGDAIPLAGDGRHDGGDRADRGALRPDRAQADHPHLVHRLDPAVGAAGGADGRQEHGRDRGRPHAAGVAPAYAGDSRAFTPRTP